MPIPLPSTSIKTLSSTPTAAITATPAPFPARTKQAVATINGIRTDVTTTAFSDKIMITVSQDGRLGHWVHVPLTSADPSLSSRRRRAEPEIMYSDDEDNGDLDLLPFAHLTATTVLGAGNSSRDTLGQLLGTQIGTWILSRRPNENRTLVLGMGFVRELDLDGEAFGEVFARLVILVGGCL